MMLFYTKQNNNEETQHIKLHLNYSIFFQSPKGKFNLTQDKIAMKIIQEFM